MDTPWYVWFLIGFDGAAFVALVIIHVLRLRK
jgi:hypothetical protein